MREMARKDFANLRQDSDDSEPQPQPQPKIVRRGRPPGKNSKKSLGTPPSERIGPESSSDATLASGGDNASGPNNYNLRKGISKFQPADSLAKASPSNLNSGGYTNWLSEWETEFPGQGLLINYFFFFFIVFPFPLGSNMGSRWLHLLQSFLFFLFFHLFCLQLLS